MKTTSTLLLSAMAFALASCGNGEKSPAANVANAQQGEPHETQINIRYVNRDSINTHYIFAEATRQANQQIETELIAYTNQLQSIMQNKQTEFQQKLQNNGFLNEQAAQAEYNKLQQQATTYDKQFAQRQEAAQAKILANAQALTDSIDNFIIDYNATKKYDAILFQEDVLYINPALDITQEVIDGLNARYNVPVATETPAKK